MTICTHATYEFVTHAEKLCRRYDGPIEVSVFAPGTDLMLTIHLIRTLRDCGHECVKQQISWHLITLEADEFIQGAFDTRHELADCAKIQGLVIPEADLFRYTDNVIFPINLARNQARSLAKTKYIMSLDIELYPTPDLSAKFIEFIGRIENRRSENQVYLLPLFELDASVVNLPNNKTELYNLHKQGKAIWFHQLYRNRTSPIGTKNRSFNIKDQDDWFEHESINEQLNIFRNQKHPKRSNDWEPFFIGTISEPEFDETMSWEGRKNKLSASIEMCLIGYKYSILDNAFLVHSPGIKPDVKIFSQTGLERRRRPFEDTNKLIRDYKVKQLERLYGRSC